MRDAHPEGFFVRPRPCPVPPEFLDLLPDANAGLLDGHMSKESKSALNGYQRTISRRPASATKT